MLVFLQYCSNFHRSHGASTRLICRRRTQATAGARRRPCEFGSFPEFLCLM